MSLNHAVERNAETRVPHGGVPIQTSGVKVDSKKSLSPHHPLYGITLFN